MEKSPADRGAVALADRERPSSSSSTRGRLCPTLSLTGDSGRSWGGRPQGRLGRPPRSGATPSSRRLPTHSPGSRSARSRGACTLTSAVFHSATVGATVLATFALSRSRLAALAAGVALGLQRSFFAGSLYAEVFPLNDLFFAALFLLALRLRSREAPPVAFVLLAGVAASHHMLIALAAPALAILVYRPLKEQPRRLVLVLAVRRSPLRSSSRTRSSPLAASREHPAVSVGRGTRRPLAPLSHHPERLRWPRELGPRRRSRDRAGEGSRRSAVSSRTGSVSSRSSFAVAGAVDLLRRQPLVGSSLARVPPSPPARSSPG